MKNFLSGFYKGKKILITGHTGFKGSWLCLVLHKLGADIYGYALEPPTIPSLFKEAGIYKFINSYYGDIRNLKYLTEVLNEVNPEIIFHMAAQPLVRESYKNPIETYEVNVMGTVNILEACRKTKSVRAIVNVTTDKCYLNREWLWGYREDEAMGGYDPYSNSKGCSELVTSAYRDSFFNSKDYETHHITLASARAGNVIGGGDWANDRLIPDFIKSISKGEKLKIRSPYAIRPWQNVLEPLRGYLTLAEKLYNEGPFYAQAWNFGPDDKDSKNVEWIANKLCSIWGEDAAYEIDSSPQPHEANYLKLDCSKAQALLDWYPVINLENSIKSIVEWNKAFLKGENIRRVTENQIDEYFRILNT